MRLCYVLGSDVCLEESCNVAKSFCPPAEPSGSGVSGRWIELSSFRRDSTWFTETIPSAYTRTMPVRRDQAGGCCPCWGTQLSPWAQQTENGPSLIDGDLISKAGFEMFFLLSMAMHCKWFGSMCWLYMGVMLPTSSYPPIHPADPSEPADPAVHVRPLEDDEASGAGQWLPPVIISCHGFLTWQYEVNLSKLTSLWKFWNITIFE